MTHTVKENIPPCLRKQSKIDAYFFKPEFTGPEKHLNFFAKHLFTDSGWIELTEIEYASIKTDEYWAGLGIGHRLGCTAAKVTEA